MGTRSTICGSQAAISTLPSAGVIAMTLNGFGIHQDADALETRASSENFALRKHNLVQAMLAVNDLFYLAQPMVRSLFVEDVVAWLDFHDIRYTPGVKFTGKSGYDHLFDFVVPNQGGSRSGSFARSPS